jgi:hypothetical protein
MAEYRIWGRIERRPEGSFRAVASALPNEPGAGPDPSDIRAGHEDSLADSRIELGRLAYDLSAAIMKRGDQVVWVDIR